jgi:hypothetical protein
MTHALPAGTVVAKLSEVEDKEWDEAPCILNECSVPKPLADIRGHNDAVPLFNEAELLPETRFGENKGQCQTNGRPQCSATSRHSPFSNAQQQA